MKQKAAVNFGFCPGEFSKLAFLSFFLTSGVFLSAQDLTIDYRYNVSGPDSGNYLTYTSAIRYIAADKDAFDAVSGASRQKSTSLFAPIQTDIMGRATISGGFRSLLMFPLAADAVRVEDNLHVYKEGNIITIEYIHRGVAYRIQTDRQGNISFPRGNYVMRTIGYIKGRDPQVISPDFSGSKSAKTADWRKIWDPKTPSGKAVDSGSETRTGPIQNDYGDMMAMFNWDGTLQVAFENSILTIKGVLRPIKR
ncbi:MAG: hypothetical protein LBR96_03025 [Treponema sp.]|jgi:hypothetical protein|nr:hypothetical protein [Treponema sp.]